ncbi:queuosine 5'-phosphate N-glycosylase/hydrolase-like [Haliotis cracherodii]|uniref:queuosine 5'-phosphate N-glycosylase/hydrolase-like n=1 Tax=Haliotis cracherodii TaxID=6455 RepID=UPI0039E81F0D
MMSGALSPRESGRFIAETSKDVTVNPDGVKKCAKHVYEEVKKTGYGVRSWRENELHPKTMDEAAVNWVFVADALNFCFWSQDPSKKYYVDYRGKRWTGYWCLCAALNRAIEEGIHITDPNFYASITQDQLASVFRSESEMDIPLFQERLDVLHQVGQVLIQKYEGSFSNCVKKCNGSAKDLLNLIVTEFPPFRDEADYNGKRVSLHKRAQILIADVWGCCEGQGLGTFHDIDVITMFADYRVPQVLVYFGALQYSHALMELLRKDTLMKNGDRLEVEIRGCSIWATELVCEEARRLKEADTDSSDLQINSILIDEFLWDYRRAHVQETDSIPYHKVRCIYY